MKNLLNGLDFTAAIGGKKLSLEDQIKELEKVLKMRGHEDKWHGVYCICEELHRRGLGELVKESGFLSFEEAIQEMKKIQEERGKAAAQGTQGKKGDFYIKTDQNGFVGFINLKHICPEGGFAHYTQKIVGMANSLLEAAKKHQ